MNYIWRRKKKEREKETNMHAQFQTKIQAIKRPNKQIKDNPNKIVLT